MIDPPPGKMALTDIVATAFDCYRRAPVSWLALTLLSFVVIFAVQWALGDRMDLPAGATEEQIQEAAPAFSAMLGTLLVLGIFTHLAIVDGATRVLSGQALGVRAAALAGLRRFLPAFVAVIVIALVVAVAVMLGSAASALGIAFLALVPLAYVFVWLVSWSLAITVIAVEHTGPFRALSRSRQIVRGRWWRTLGFSLAIIALGLLPGFVFSAAGGRIGQTWATALGVALGSAIAAPFNGIAQTLLYADLRARKGEKPFEPVTEALP